MRKLLLAAVAAVGFGSVRAEGEWDYTQHLLPCVIIPADDYVNTELVYHSIPTAEMTYMIRSTDSKGDVFGTQTAKAGCFQHRVDYGQFYFRYGTEGHRGAVGTHVPYTVYTVQCDTNLTVNGTVLQNEVLRTDADFAGNTEPITFPGLRGGTTYRPEMSVFSFKMTTNDTDGVAVPAFDLVPCEKDGTVGFYDKVTGRFLTTQSGMAYAGTATGGKALVIDVPTGNVQTDLTDEQLASLAKLTASDEVRKTGGGTLHLTSITQTKIRSFAGTIRIREGIYRFDGSDGYLGTTAGPTIVEDGATLWVNGYVGINNFLNEDIRISGTGAPGMGGALVGNSAQSGGSNVNLGKLSLDGDATVYRSGSAKLSFFGAAIDLGGHTLTHKSAEAFRAEIASIFHPTSIANPGNIVFESGKIDFTGGIDSSIPIEWNGCAENMLTFGPDVSVPALGSITLANCPWTLKFLKDVTFDLTGMSLDRPLVIGEGCLLTLKPPAGFPSFAFGDVLSGDGNVKIDLSKVNDEFFLFYAGYDRTRVKGTFEVGKTAKKEFPQMVYLSKKAFPDWETAEMTGFPKASNVVDGNICRHTYFAGQTAARPDGWTSSELWTILKDFHEKGLWGFGVFVDPGLDFTLTCGEPLGGTTWNSQSVNALGGGRLRIAADFVDKFRNFLTGNGVGNVVYVAKDRAVSDWTEYNNYGGDVTFEDITVALGTAQYWYISGARNRYDVPARFTVGRGAVTAASSDDARMLYACANSTGSRAVITLADGGIISNGLWLASRTDEVHGQCGSFIQRGGAMRAVVPASAVRLGGNTNGIGYVEVNAGEFTATCPVYLGYGTTSLSYGNFTVNGGTVDIDKVYGTAHTTLFRQRGGELTVRNQMGVPTDLGSGNRNGGTETLVFENGVQPQISGGIVLGGRIDSTGSVSVVRGAMVRTPFVRRAATVGTAAKVPAGDNAAFVSFDGGGLMATSDGAQLLGAGETAVSRATVHAGGVMLGAEAGVTASVDVPLTAPAAGGIASLTFEGTALDDYTAAPFVRICGKGTGAVAVANLDSTAEKVTGVTVIAPGEGYDGETTAELTIGGEGKADVPLAVATAESQVSGGLVKTGPGTIVLNAANAYGGETVVSNGVLRLGVAGALPSASVRLAGGTLDAAAGVAYPDGLTLDVSGIQVVEGMKYDLARHYGAGMPTVSGVPDGWRAYNAGGTIRLGIPKGMVLTVR